jgi:signal transduction histidine kinase
MVALQRGSRGRKLLIDAAVAVVVFAASLAMLAADVRESEADARTVDALAVVLAAFASLPLVLRRRAPLAVFALTAGASAVLNGLGYPPGPPLGPTVALFFLALSPPEARVRPWLTGATVAGFFLLHAGAVGVGQDEFPTVPLLLGALVWGGAWVVGDRIRLRRERVAQLEERALRAEREAEREGRLAAAQERTRIARDLHDSAGHAINVILVQAGAARLLHEQDPQRSKAALETIEEVARETIREIDHLVRALRDDGPEQADAVDPPSGLAAVETLAHRHRAAGLDVDITVDGSRRQLSFAVDQAAYRILQEALTNAARHGDGRAAVVLSFGRAALEITVTNTLRAGRATEVGAPGGGHGVAGMRERAALLGGQLEAGPNNGAFRVRARLPYAAEESR